MRFVALLLLALASCQSSASEALDSGANGDDETDGEVPGSSSAYCTHDYECALAASACCACPSYAGSIYDPAVDACGGVMCPSEPDCENNVRAACDLQSNQCVLQCVELACDQSYEGGFAMDPATGCLACVAGGGTDASMGCEADTDCVQTREDCCGCANGGEDTAVLASERGAFDASLGCSASTTCPGVNRCEVEAAPRCIQGACVLTPATLPSNACGRGDLPACPSGQACTLNHDPSATELGVGVCTPI